MLRSIERNLPLSMWEDITVGMLLGYVIEYNNEQLDDDEMKPKEATQADFNRF